MFNHIQNQLPWLFLEISCTSAQTLFIFKLLVHFAHSFGKVEITVSCPHLYKAKDKGSV